MSKNLVPDSQNVFVYSSKIIVVEYRHEGQKSQHPGSFENIPEKHKLVEMPHLDRGCLTLGAEANIWEICRQVHSLDSQCGTGCYDMHALLCTAMTHALLCTAMTYVHCYALL